MCSRRATSPRTWAGLATLGELKEMPENRRMMQLIRARLETLLA